MIILWLLLVTKSLAQDANSTDDSEVSEDFHSTILYPVLNPINNSANGTTKTVLGRTTWKLDAAYAETKSEKSTDNIKEIDEHNVTTVTEDKPKSNNVNMTIAKENAIEVHGCSDFKPSQHLGSFVEDEDLTNTYGVPSIVADPGFQFVSSQNNEHNTIFNTSPIDGPTYKKYQFSFNPTIHKTYVDTRTPDTLDPRPTAKIPVRVPAGGLYKLEDPFAVVAGVSEPSFNHDQGHALKIKEDFNENNIKRRVNPWRSMLRLVTALAPAGLIISALTPSVINLRSTGPEARHRTRLVRSSDHTWSELPAISEQCRRRLLCELHSEVNYKKSESDPKKGRHCYKIYCEDPQAMWKMLQWLLTYYQPRSSNEKDKYFKESQ